MLLELRNHNDVLKRNVKRNYSSFDKMRVDIVSSFYEQCKSYDTKQKHYDLEIVFGDFELVKNMTLSEIFELLDNNADKAILSNYIYLLWCICLVWGMLEDRDQVSTCLK